MNIMKIAIFVLIPAIFGTSSGPCARQLTYMNLEGRRLDRIYQEALVISKRTGQDLVSLLPRAPTKLADKLHELKLFCPLFALSDHPRLNLREAELLSRYRPAQEHWVTFMRTLDRFLIPLQRAPFNDGHCVMILFLIESHLDDNVEWQDALASITKSKTPMLNDWWLTSSKIHFRRQPASDFDLMMSYVREMIYLEVINPNPCEAERHFLNWQMVAMNPSATIFGASDCIVQRAKPAPEFEDVSVEDNPYVNWEYWRVRRMNHQATQRGIATGLPHTFFLPIVSSKLRDRISQVERVCPLLVLSDHPTLNMRKEELLARYRPNEEYWVGFKPALEQLVSHLRDDKPKQGYCFIIVYLIASYLDGNEEWKSALSLPRPLDKVSTETPLLDDLWMVASLTHEHGNTDSEFDQLMSFVPETVRLEVINRDVEAAKDLHAAWKAIQETLGVYPQTTPGPTYAPILMLRDLGY